MMRRVAILLCPLWLGACDAFAPTLVSPPLSPEAQACSSQADQDPALQQARAISAGQPNWEFHHEPEMRRLRQDAITRCLRARGLAPRGGVERPR